MTVADALREAVALLRSEAESFRALHRAQPQQGWESEANAYEAAANLVEGLI